MKIQPVWYDGICNVCGGKVYETTCSERSDADYKNACSNEACKENHWHYVGDQETLAYYTHESSSGSSECFEKDLNATLSDIADPNS